jgi:lipoprotein-releasing system ATP-binding protein
MNNHPEILLQCLGITKSYHDSGDSLKVLDALNFDLRKGEIAAISGSSGSGKSTLLNLLGGLDCADAGEVLFGGQPLPAMNHSLMDKWRLDSVGFVFQFHHLLPEFSLLENVLLPARNKSGFRKEDVARAMELLDKVGIASRAKHLPSECSGGERQRAAVARSLINRPAMVLMDEPSGNLDHHNTTKLHALIEELNRDLGQAFVIVTHDRELAARAHRRWYLDEGRCSLVQDDEA